MIGRDIRAAHRTKLMATIRPNRNVICMSGNGLETVPRAAHEALAARQAEARARMPCPIVFDPAVTLEPPAILPRVAEAAGRLGRPTLAARGVPKYSPRVVLFIQPMPAGFAGRQHGATSCTQLNTTCRSRHQI